MIANKVIALLRTYKAAIRNYQVFKNYLPYLSRQKFYAVKALGKEGFCNHSEQTLNFTSKTPQSEKRLVKLALLPIRKLLVFKGTAERFEGDLILRTVNGDVKVFSFSQGLVLNFMADKAKYQELKSIYDYYGRFFQTPVIDQDDEKQCFTEKLIDHAPFEDLTDTQHDRLLQELLRSTEKHIASLDKTTLKNLDVQAFAERFNKCFQDYEHPIISHFLDVTKSETVDPKVPLIPCHGDPQKNNVLLHGKDVFFIDWEYAQEYVFYYDPIYMLTEPHIYRPQSKVAVEPFTVNNFEALQRLFSLFDINITWQNLPYYLCLALMQRLIQAKENGNSNINYDLECFAGFWGYFEEKYKEKLYV